MLNRGKSHLVSSALEFSTHPGFSLPKILKAAVSFREDHVSTTTYKTTVSCRVKKSKSMLHMSLPVGLKLSGPGSDDQNNQEQYQIV